MKIETVENKAQDDILVSWHDLETQEHILRWSPREGDFAYKFIVPDVEIIDGKQDALEKYVRIFILWAKNRGRDISPKSWKDCRAWLKDFSLPTTNPT